SLYEEDYVTVARVADSDLSPEAVEEKAAGLRSEMRAAIEDLDVERAALIRDELYALENNALMAGFEAPPKKGSVSPGRRRGAGRGGRKHR
ncbi:MAG: UvrB/UvrC motif-containing protein, partial [Myxococcota bacterium]